MNYNDEQLGQLSFYYGWKKDINICLNSYDSVVPCIFDAYSNTDSITGEQKQSYQLFDSKKEYFEDIIYKALMEYIQQKGIIHFSFVPKTLLFKRNGAVGLLLDCDWDIDNGVVVIILPEIKVGIQDLFL